MHLNELQSCSHEPAEARVWAQTHAQVWRSAGASERARTIVAAEFRRALEAPTLDAFDDGRPAGDAPTDADAAPEAAQAGGGGGSGAGAGADDPALPYPPHVNGAVGGNGGGGGGRGSSGAAGAEDGGGLELERALAGASCVGAAHASHTVALQTGVVSGNFCLWHEFAGLGGELIRMRWTARVLVYRSLAI